MMSLDLLAMRSAGIVPNPSKEAWTDHEAYRQLYVSIITLAIKDYEFLRRINGRVSLSPSERKKLRGLTEDSDPVEFFNSRWFEDICGMIGVHPQAIRERLEIEEGMDLLAALS
ncbi:MAG TPA: hypothetical protein QGG47_05750 [Acidobacteriota bacterium]|nr:hypothetical protein [Acidobacteriota bacterium]